MTPGGNTLQPMSRRAVAEKLPPPLPASADAPAHFIKQWRKFRKLTQEQLAEKSGLSESSISQLEKFKQGYSVPTLEKIAAALDCRPGDLLSRDPLADAELWETWARLKPETKRRAAKLLRALLEDDEAA